VTPLEGKDIMEKQLYYDYPYVKEFDARVLSSEKRGKFYETVLDRTAFYPEGGGQPADGGILDGKTVLDVQERDGRIFHRTAEPLTAGSLVHGAIDWEKRFSLTQEHSGEHIVSGLIHRAYGYNNVGYHMGEEIQLDLDGVLTWEQLLEIEHQANEIIWKNVPLHIWYPSPEELRSIDYRSKKELTGTVRLVEIPGADVCACCGTHVERTGEIGLVKFMSMIHYKGGVRIMMLCGRKAVRAFDEKLDSTREICTLLSAKPGESAEAVRRLWEEGKEKDLAIGELTRELFRLKAMAIPGGQKVLVDTESGFSAVEIRKFCDYLMQEKKAEVVCILRKNGEGKNASLGYCIGSLSRNLRDAAGELNRELHGRGGGSPQMIQGSFSADEDKVREVLSARFAGGEADQGD
jgi:alanyl-tRNA synthetase